MNIEDKDIDQLFRDAAGAHKAPVFDPAYWKEMNQILQQKSSAKRMLALWLSFGIAVFAVLIAILFTLNNEPQEVRYSQNKLKDYKILKSLSNPSNPNQNRYLEEENQNVAQQAAEESSGVLKDNRRNSATKTKNVFKSKVENIGQSAYKLSDNKNQYLESKVEAKTEEEDQKIALGNEKNVNFGNYSDKDNVSIDSKNSSSLLVENNLPIRVNAIPEQNIYQLIPLKKIKYKNPIRYRLYTQLGAGLMENYMTKSPFKSADLDLSLRMEMNIHNLSIRTGLGSQLTTNLDLMVSKRTEVSTFGITEYQSDLSYQNLLDLYIPIELGYRIKSTQFGVGVQENFLTTSSMNLKKYADHVLINSQFVKGHTEGLRKFTTLGYVWMEYHFSPVFSLGAKLGTNLTSRIKKGEYFNNSVLTNSLFGQLTLRFDLLK